MMLHPDLVRDKMFEVARKEVSGWPQEESIQRAIDNAEYCVMELEGRCGFPTDVWVSLTDNYVGADFSEVKAELRVRW